LDNEDD